MWADLPANLGLDEVEVCTLLDACLLEDRAASLRRLVKRQGQMLGEKLHPAISEERQCRMAARRLVATIDMTGRPQRAQAKSARARVAANARWGASGA